MVLVSYSLNLFYLFGMEQLRGSLLGREAGRDEYNYSPLACFQEISGVFISRFMRNGTLIAAGNMIHIADGVNSRLLVLGVNSLMELVLRWCSFGSIFVSIEQSAETRVLRIVKPSSPWK